MVDDTMIDWDCEVHRNYQEKNLGCDPSEFLSQQWAFSLTDKCIVLEDDDVPSLSFFTFCKEMLDKYEDDPRVTMVAGFNTDEDSRKHLKAVNGTVPDYFFTRAFSIWGWASWARVIRNLDGEYGFVHDKAQFEKLKEKAKLHRQRSEMIPLCLHHSTTGIPYYETIFWAYMTLNDGLAIMPSVNLINNITLTEGRTMPRSLICSRNACASSSQWDDMSYNSRFPTLPKSWKNRAISNVGTCGTRGTTHGARYNTLSKNCG